ncbi:MAG: Required for respiratory growth protein 9 mitochondrial [Chrysothrix sp. TS-e1954]|nr:MAG: Required for respiratory growth protein 9 mitochondrial [Chrysothrix sp. TS-e1954]
MAGPFCAGTAINFASRRARRTAVDALAFQLRLRSPRQRYFGTTSSHSYLPSGQRSQASAATPESIPGDDQWIPFDSPVDTNSPQTHQHEQPLHIPFRPPPPPEPTPDSFKQLSTSSPLSPDPVDDLTHSEAEIVLRDPFSESQGVSPTPHKKKLPVHSTDPTQEQASAGKMNTKDSRVSRTPKAKDDWGMLYQRSPIEGEFFAAGRTQKKKRTSPDKLATGKISEEVQERRTETLSRAARPKVAQPKRDDWQLQKNALRDKFGDEAWSPRKRLSPDALEGIRAMNAQYPDHFTTPVLADHFKVSPEAIRRILKSKWRANAAEEEDRRARWDRRGERIWEGLVEKGVHAPKKWRDMGIGRGSRKAPTILFPTPSKDRKSRGSKLSEDEQVSSAWLDSLSQRVA